MKSRHWILLLGGILILSLAGMLLFSRLGTNGTLAEIYQDDRLIRTIDLSAVTEPEEIPILAEGRENIILVQPGQISMKTANCPDHLCVRQGAIKNGVYPIVCLPNHIVIKIINSGASQVDAVSN